MALNLQWTAYAWDDYCEWQQIDQTVHKRINALIKNVLRDPFRGIGKPEPLKGRKDTWSRRITEKDRLVYIVEADKVIIITCKNHYA